jgi:hypothetical protein
VFTRQVLPEQRFSFGPRSSNDRRVPKARLTESSDVSLRTSAARIATAADPA